MCKLSYRNVFVVRVPPSILISLLDPARAMADVSVCTRHRYVHLHCPWQAFGMPPLTQVPIPEWRVPLYGPMYVVSEQDMAVPPGLHRVTDAEHTSMARSSDEPPPVNIGGNDGKMTDATPAAR